MSADEQRGPVWPILERLLEEQGLRPGEWWPFLVQGEGTMLPSGIEESSGFALAKDGRVYGWWLGWDMARGGHTLARWWRVEEPEREFAEDVEYQEARRRLGSTLGEE